MAQIYSGQPERNEGTALAPMPQVERVHPIIDMYRQKNDEFAALLHNLESSRMPGVWVSFIEILIAQHVEEIFLNIQDGDYHLNEPKIQALQNATQLLRNSEYGVYGENLEKLIQHIIHLAHTYRDQAQRAA